MIAQEKREGFRTVTPYIITAEPERLLDFVGRAFEGTETLRGTGSAGGMHAEVRIGDSMVMIGGGKHMEGQPVTLYLYLTDVDAVYQRALRAGATSLMEPVDQPYGDRLAGVKDPCGNVWYIATHLGTSEISS